MNKCACCESACPIDGVVTRKMRVDGEEAVLCRLCALAPIGRNYLAGRANDLDDIARAIMVVGNILRKDLYALEEDNRD